MTVSHDTVFERESIETPHEEIRVKLIKVQTNNSSSLKFNIFTTLSIFYQYYVKKPYMIKLAATKIIIMVSIKEKKLEF